MINVHVDIGATDIIFNSGGGLRPAPMIRLEPPQQPVSMFEVVPLPKFSPESFQTAQVDSFTGASFLTAQTNHVIRNGLKLGVSRDADSIISFTIGGILIFATEHNLQFVRRINSQKLNVQDLTMIRHLSFAGTSSMISFVSGNDDFDANTLGAKHGMPVEVQSQECGLIRVQLMENQQNNMISTRIVHKKVDMAENLAMFDVMLDESVSDSRKVGMIRNVIVNQAATKVSMVEHQKPIAHWLLGDLMSAGWYHIRLNLMSVLSKMISSKLKDLNQKLVLNSRFLFTHAETCGLVESIF